MFQNDYLMRMILQLTTAIQRSLNLQRQDPKADAEEIEYLVGEAVGIDAGLLFSLSPESIVSMLQLGNFDEDLSGYVLRSMYYESGLLEAMGRKESADLRRSQADAIALAYGIEISSDDLSDEALQEFFSTSEDEGEGEGAEPS
jgi:hypothetical protein